MILTHAQALAIVTAVAHLNNVGGKLTADLNKTDEGNGTIVFENAQGVYVATLEDFDHTAKEFYFTWDDFAKAYNV